MTLKNFFSKKFNDNLSENVNLANYSWFNLGGNAEYFYKAEDKDQLIDFLKEAKNKTKITILGAGSNTLFRDNGFKGCVIKLGKNFSFAKLLKHNIVEVGGATLDRKISEFAKDNSLGGLEFLSCIPGSIGGAVIMNSGCYENDISKILISVKAIDLNELKEIEIKKQDIKFLYRGTNLPKDLIIISAKLQGVIEEKRNRKKQNNLIEKKKFPNQVK